MYLTLEDLNKSFGARTVVRNLSFGIEKGELLCLLGESGCGKTTTLNMLGGFLPPDSGRILLEGQDITALPPEQRPITTVFQAYSLFMHMNVLQNVLYGLKFRGIPRKEAQGKAMEYLRMVGLESHADARIAQLSGGQQQRVALARALIVEPKVLLLDEPFCNLDAGLRVKMREELKQIQQRLSMTMVFVTHDQEEALTLADKIGVMHEGQLAQLDTPREIMQAPANDFVRGFMQLSGIETLPDGRLVKPVLLRAEAPVKP